MPDIKALSIKHEAIMDYLLMNPASKLGDVAAHFRVSQAWLSVIIHSDAFQAQLAEKNEALFVGTVLPLREQLLGVAHLGVEKLGEALENASPGSDKQFIADTTTTVLASLGFTPKNGLAPQGGVNMQQNNYYMVEKEALAEAREKMRLAHAQPVKGELIEQSEAPTPAEVPASRSDSRG